MLGFLIRAALVALGLWLATDWVSGVAIQPPIYPDVEYCDSKFFGRQL